MNPYYVQALLESLSDKDGKANALELGFALGYFGDRFKDLSEEQKARIIEARAAADRKARK